MSSTGMFSPVPKPPTTDELVNSQFSSGQSLPMINNQAMNAALPPNAQVPAYGQGYQPKPTIPMQQAQQKKQVTLNEDAIMQHLSGLNPVQAEDFMNRVNQKLMFLRYRETITGSLESNYNCLYNPHQRLILVFLESEEDGHTITIIPYDLVEPLRNDPKIFTVISIVTADDLEGLLKEWYADITDNYLQPYIDTLQSLTGKDSIEISKGGNNGDGH